MVGLLLLLLMFATAIGGLAFYYRYRRQKVAEVAQRLGLDFFPAEQVYEELDGLYLARFGAKPHIENCLHGAADGTAVRIFEYRCFFPKAMASHTVALLTTEGLELPRFLLRPRHRLALLDPYSSLAPPPLLIREDFDRDWIVAGDDCQRVRQLFDDALIDFVLANKWWMEGEGNRLAIYRWDYTINHTFLEDFFRQAYQALTLLKLRRASVQCRDLAAV